MTAQLDEETRRRLAAVNDRIAGALFGHSREPRWRYFTGPDGVLYFWTTEPYDADAPWQAGNYVSGAYVPRGKGARSGKASRWEVADDSISGHRLRKDAKARALRLYDRAKAGQRRPWAA